MAHHIQAIARRMQEAWAQAFANKDWAGLARLYTDRPAFYGSTPELHASRAGVQAYFQSLPASLSAVRYATPTATPLGHDCFAASGEVVFVARGPDGDLDLAFRMTQIFLREADGWRIAVHHASTSPGPLLPP